MALSASTIHEVWTTGSDTNNGGMFDPSQTAGMFTDGAATSANTSAPVFSSASYNFVAGDVGAWVYIASGTNWTAGWYKISSVASNVATLNGAIGQGVLKAAIAKNALSMAVSTTVGCATTASPTGATWTIDYSQQAAAQFTYTDLASAGTGLTVSSAAKPFAKQQVGNSIVITGGTNFNTGRYVIASVAAAVATVVGPTNITTGAGASGTGGMGGAWASPGKPFSVWVAENIMFLKSGTYAITSASTNISSGCLAPPNNVSTIVGYGSVRNDLGTKPLLQASGISTFTLIAFTNNQGLAINLSLDGASLTSSRGTSNGMFYKCSSSNFTNGAHFQGYMFFCSATGCSTVAPFGTFLAYGCEAYSNTVTGFNTTTAVRCISRNNTGASTDGFTIGQNYGSVINSVAYNNGRHGFSVTILSGNLINNIAEGNAGWGYNGTGQGLVMNNASYSNTSGSYSLTSLGPVLGFVINSTGSFFTNAAGGDFSLNALTGQGALARAAGIPGAFPVASTTGYPDIGAAQHADPAGGGPVMANFRGGFQN